MHTVEDTRTHTERFYTPSGRAIVTRVAYTEKYYPEPYTANPWACTIIHAPNWEQVSHHATRDEAEKQAAWWYDRYMNPDTSSLSPQLTGLEGWRVEVVTTYGETRRFYVGMSTGWQPVHLEIARRDSSGGGAADREYASVRKLYKR
jgi:hypothetical protein